MKGFSMQSRPGAEKDLYWFKLAAGSRGLTGQDVD